MIPYEMRISIGLYWRKVGVNRSGHFET
ncbi:Protein of unknown function [Bacillus cytotoxicus]|uniref:Uncharacterized protein n=1 Tax=Bacillus cytotoxicus TaxID=580165 RepID=A0AAX2CG63_9BACI|nr:Protein of unknown function [Bacillus cytotoxicus]